LHAACRSACAAAGLSKQVTVHTLRHYAEFRIMPSDLRIVSTGDALIQADSA
jgi:hypothetical protein